MTSFGNPLTMMISACLKVAPMRGWLQDRLVHQTRLSSTNYIRRNLDAMSVDFQLSQLPERVTRTPSEGRPLIIGLYGIPGSGKTYLMDKLRDRCGEDNLSFFEGSKMIGEVTPGGLDAFKKLDQQMKDYYRTKAINKIQENSLRMGKVSIVSGHFMLWSEAEKTARLVYTEGDLQTFTHIIYLDTPAKVIDERHQNDTTRQDRPFTTALQLHQWQKDERNRLRSLCYDNGILFLQVHCEMPMLLEKVSDLIWNFCGHSDLGNLMRATKMLDEYIGTDRDNLDTMLVIDADKTLAAIDTGKVFWQRISEDGEDLLKTLFSSPMGYSYTAFRQAALLYEEVREDHDLDDICENVASSVTIHSEFTSLLQKVANQDRVGAVIVTCELHRVWEKALQRAGLSESVKVIGAGYTTDTDACVVTAGVKAALVTALQQIHHMYVWAFGDSTVDLEMLRMADEAIVVVGDERTRSKTMEMALNAAIDKGLRARQVLLQSSTTPRLDVTKLPMTDFPEHDILHKPTGRLAVVHATNRNAAKLLATVTRNANVAGPALRESHRRVGWYLATEFLADTIGLQGYDIPHVQGSKTTGYRLFDEKNTTIVALMRGGEPMAYGVNDAFPLAMFIHAKDANDLKAHHVQNQRTIVLVDSVVNSGKSILDFTNRIRSLHRSVRIVIVTAVVQAQAVCGESPLVQAFQTCGKRTLIALRVSDNKYIGTGSTDTGNRLFNTTHLA